MFKNKISPFTCIIISLLVFIATFVGVSANRSVSEKAVINQYRLECESHIKVSTEDEADFRKMAEIMEIVNKNHIKEYDKTVLWDNVFQTIALSLNDKYSQYFTKDEYNQMLNSSDGDYIGIGVRVVNYSQLGGIYVYSVVSGSPAKTAGLQPGDLILAVDGKEYNGENFNEITGLISGKEGTTLVLTIRRGEKTLELTVKRETVANENVIYKKMDNNIAYICIYSFSDATVAAQFSNIISLAQNDGCEKFIFDVRNNPGGYLEQICQTLDILLPEGPIINIVSNGATATETSDANCIETKGMVVLCNGNTASAAELFTAALRDYKLAQIVGTTTFGKGTLQTTFQLNDGSTFKLSTAYYTPLSNENYDGKGIIPDCVIELPEEWKNLFYAMPSEADSQLHKAIEILNSTN